MLISNMSQDTVNSLGLVEAIFTLGNIFRSNTSLRKINVTLEKSTKKEWGIITFFFVNTKDHDNFITINTN